MTTAIKKELKRRAVVEPLIGHLKNEGHLGRNYLKGVAGDKINVLLTAAGYNFRLLLRWLRRFFGLAVSRLMSLLHQLWALPNAEYAPILC